MSLLVFNWTRDFDNKLDDSTVNNFSASESKSEDSDDNEDPYASDSEATAGVDPIAMPSSSSGIHQADEADSEAPEDAEELNINDGMSQFYCWSNLTYFFKRNFTRTRSTTSSQA